MLLRKSVAISHRGVARALLDTHTPGTWKKSPLLRHHRLIVLNAEGRCTYGAYVLFLDAELGVRVIQSAEENS